MKFNLATLLLLIPLSTNAGNGGYSCPMDIVPGKAIGPFNFNLAVASIQNAFAKAKLSAAPGDAQTGKTTYIDLDGLHISFCKDKVTDIWVDVKSVPTRCLRYKGTVLPKRLKITYARKLMGGCPTEVTRIGGSFFECESGLRIGVGSGGNGKEADQIRIGPGLDMACAP